MKKNGLEWSVFGVSSLLILAALGGLVRDMFLDRGQPPSLSIEAGPAIRAGDGWRVPFVVRNTGDISAEAVKLEAEAGEQKASADVDYVPRGSERAGAFVFTEEPTSVKANVAGYQEP